MMTFFKKLLPTTFTIGENEIGLLFRDQQFHALLTTGKRRFNSFSHDWTLKTVSLGAACDKWQQNSDILFLAEKYPAAFAEHLECCQTGENEIALLERDGILTDILPPVSAGFFWRGERVLTVSKQTIADAEPIDPTLWQRIKRAKGFLGLPCLQSATIPAQHIGLHLINEVFTQTCPPGEYAWWTLGSNMNMLAVDLRLQNMDISGQEILTKDRVSIRLNLLASWKITDAEKLVLQVKEYKDFLYREMQLALRTVVATKTLDELLADKNILNDEIKQIVLPIAAAQGIDVLSVGVKDVILPGEMKTILSKVVEAQKLAEANNIRLREETQSTRSLHNTAKVMENNPTLMRLKELETLERITAHIDQLNVYGGLDELMNKLVTLRDVTGIPKK